MSFVSLAFIFVFLPVTLILYYLLPKGNWQKAVLVLSSLFFFAWADVRHLPVLLLSVLINFLLGLLIERLRSKNRVKFQKLVLWTGVALNLLVLAYYKYLGNFSDFIASISSGRIIFKEQVLFLGISYLTFTSLSYLLDIYKGIQSAEKNILKTAAYLIMFPKLIQGPITLYRDLAPQLDHHRKFLLKDLHDGVRRFIFGLAKKVLIADMLSVVVKSVYEVEPQLLGADLAWIGLIAFSLVIYFDFSGYTDMALGIGRMFGFKLPENFSDPYASRSATDFWRRWHMSLTNWFRTYIFLPLEFARRHDKFLRQQTDILLVFFLTGLWHGVGWNFLIWGVYYGIILAVEASGFGRKLRKAPVFLQHVYALIVVIIGWEIFSIPNLQRSLSFLSSLFGFRGLTGVYTLRSMNIIFYLPIMVLAILFVFPLPWHVLKVKRLRPGLQMILADVMSIGIFLISLAYILSNGFQVFMYAQF